MGTSIETFFALPLQAYGNRPGEGDSCANAHFLVRESGSGGLDGLVFLLARAATRQREIATRLALGSSRSRIARKGLIETVLLAVGGGGLLGLAVAFAATRILIAFVSEGSAWIAVSPMPNPTVLAFTLGVSVIAGVLFGFVPAITTARTEAHDSLGSTNRTSGGGRGRSSRWWPKSLVVGQVMLSLLLLVTAGFFLRTLRNLQHQNYGFERRFLLVAQFDASYLALRHGYQSQDCDGESGPGSSLLPKGNAIGHTLTIGIDSVKGPWQIVGIARGSVQSFSHFRSFVGLRKVVGLK